MQHFTASDGARLVYQDEGEGMRVLALSTAACYMILKHKSGGAASGNATAAKPAGWVDEIVDLVGKKFTNGWRYFPDGTDIDPLGNC